MRTPTPIVSTIIVTRNEGDYLRQTVEDFERTLPPRREIIVIDDGSTDGSVDFLRDRRGDVRVIATPEVGVARARNTGARTATGEVLLFSDAHVRIEEGSWQPLIDALQNPVAGGVNPAVSEMGRPDSRIGYGMKLGGFDLSSGWLYERPAAPQSVPLLLWACAAMRRSLFEETGGFDEGMIRWGSIDNEMSFRLALEGFELHVVPEVRASHLFRTTQPYPLTWVPALHNRVRLALVHFEPAHCAKVIDALRGHVAFPEGMALMAGSDLASRRRALAPRKVRDSAWWFATMAGATA